MRISGLKRLIIARLPARPWATPGLLRRATRPRGGRLAPYIRMIRPTPGRPCHIQARMLNNHPGRCSCPPACRPVATIFSAARPLEPPQYPLVKEGCASLETALRAALQSSPVSRRRLHPTQQEGRHSPHTCLASAGPSRKHGQTTGNLPTPWISHILGISRR